MHLSDIPANVYHLYVCSAQVFVCVHVFVLLFLLSVLCVLFVFRLCMGLMPELKFKLENVAINDVLPLTAARRDAIANLKCFWGLEHQRPNFDGYIYIQNAAPPYSARISAMYFLAFGNVWMGSVSACNAWEAQCRIHEGWMRTLILF